MENVHVSLPIVAGEEKMLERWRLILQPDLLLARVAARKESVRKIEPRDQLWIRIRWWFETFFFDLYLGI